MHRFRKKKKSPSSTTPATNQPPTSTSPIPLATSHPRINDQRVLVASSSALPLSITCNPGDDELDVPGSSKESSWKAAYGAARMAVEIANASSDMFLPLKAVVGALSVLIQNYDRTTANVERIREIEERVQSLSEILASPVGDQDNEEKARRKALRKKLVRIIVKLGPLSEQHGLLKFLRNVDQANVLNGFVQDLTYALSDYQTFIQQSIYENTRKIDENTRNIIEAADLELLEKLDPVRTAGHQAGHHDTCLRGTRQSVLDGIMKWAIDPRVRHVYWLNGLAGTGKSTIAQTFSEMVARTGILGASFFCSRDYIDRRELKNIFPTLSYQLACRYPAFRSQVIRTIKQDPSVAKSSLITQLKDLIIEPLSSTNISCIIVVDALDECVDDQPASALLSVLGRHVKSLSSAKFFITGRPEPRIRSGFRLPLLEPFTQIFLLHQVESTNVDGDIRLYLQEKLSAIAKRRSDLDLSDPWPSDEDLTALTKKSSGLFIFASTLVRFIESDHHEPNKRLQLIVNPPESTVQEGRAGIDLLYTQVFLHAFSDAEEAVEFEILRRVLGAVLLAFHPLSGGQISKILGIDTSISTTLRHLHSVLLVPNEDSKEIRVFHKSFPDFLQDPNRCCDPRFFINSPVHHGEMALGCLELLKKLKPNPCGLPKFVMNRDVGNLPELLKDKVGSATEYACGYWAMHVLSSPITGDYAVRLVASAVKFLEGNALPWIEVMSLENRLESVIHNIYNLLEWIGKVDDCTNPPPRTSRLHSLAEDCVRFTMHFYHPIQQSAPHIYHSLLPLSPQSSKFPSMFQEWSAVSEFHGRPYTWGTTVRTIRGNFTCMTTLGHRIAASCHDGTVGIYDSITGVLKLSLGPTDQIRALSGTPDGSLLFCIHANPSVTVWDIQTGGLTHTFTTEQSVENIAISLKGRYLAGRFPGGSVVKIWKVESKAERASIQNGPPVTHIRWLEPERRLAVIGATSVHIWKIGGKKALHHFDMQENIHDAVYSQKLNSLAISTAWGAEGAITIICPDTGTRRSTCIVHCQFTCFTLSITEEDLACGMKTPGIQLFNIHQRDLKSFILPTIIKSVSTLPNGTVAANTTDSGIQFLRLDRSQVSSEESSIRAFTVQLFDDDKILTAVSLKRDSIIVLELSSMSALLTIPARKNARIPKNRTAILCASHENHRVVRCYKEEGIEYIEFWRFGGRGPERVVEVAERPSAGSISGHRLVTYHNGHHQPYVCIWDVTWNGQFKWGFLVDPPRPVHPLEFIFETQDRFYIYDDTCCIRCVATWSNDTNPWTVTHVKRPPPVRRSRRSYDVDDTREWVVCGSKKIFWIPPGYIRSTQPDYLWVGRSLLMIGQDGTLRKLTFQTDL